MNPGKLLPTHPACGEGFRPAAAGAAGRDVGVSVTTRALGDALRARSWAPTAPATIRHRRAAAAVDGWQPRWVARPRSLDEAAPRAWRSPTTKGSPSCPRGSGSAQALGGPPERADVVLDLARPGRDRSSTTPTT